MSLSFASIPLPLQTPLHAAWLEQVHPPSGFEAFDPWNFSHPAIESLPTPSAPEGPPRDVGVLHWPTGATRPAWFNFVCDDATLVRIRAALGNPQVAAPLVLNDGRSGKTITAAKMFMLPPTPLRQHLPAWPASRPGNWYVRLTDIRFFSQWKAGRVTATDRGSWTSLYSRLASILGWTLSAESVAGVYGSPSPKWDMDYRPAEVVLDAAAAQVGQRVVAALDGTFKTVGWAAAKTAADALVAANPHPVSGGYLDQTDIQRYVPESVTVLFPDSSGGSLAAAPNPVVKTLTGLAVPGYGAATGMPGASVPVPTDLVFDGTNATARDDCATRTAADWYGWRLPAVDIAFPGVEPWVPTGWEDYVEWTYQKREDQPFAETLVRRGPFSAFPSGSWATAAQAAGGDCSKAASWQTTDCLEADLVSAVGHCANVASGQVSRLAWNAGLAAWAGDDPFAANGHDWTVLYDWPEGNCCPRLRLTRSTGSASSVTVTPKWLRCDGETVTFGTSDDRLCTATAATPCGDNLLTVTVKCLPVLPWWCIESDAFTGCVQSCQRPVGAGLVVHSGPYATKPACDDGCCVLVPNPRYDGPGWYCLCDYTVAEYTEDPTACVCIFSGPFDTEEDATAECQAVVTCHGNTIKKNVHFAVVAETNCDCLMGYTYATVFEPTMTGLAAQVVFARTSLVHPPPDVPNPCTPGDPTLYAIRVFCQDGVGLWTVGGDNGVSAPVSFSVVSVRYSPFVLVVDLSWGTPTSDPTKSPCIPTDTTTPKTIRFTLSE